MGASSCRGMEGALLASPREGGGDSVWSAYRLGLGFVWARCSQCIRRGSERRSTMSTVHRGETVGIGREGSTMAHAA